MTCYQYLTENKIEFTKTDISNIGMAVCAAAKEQGLVYTKIKQQEGKSTFRVSTFPDTFTPTIALVTKVYFKEQAAKAIIMATPVVVKPTVSKKLTVDTKPFTGGKGKLYMIEEVVGAPAKKQPIAVKKEAVKPKPVFDNKKINVQIKKVRKRIPLKPELKKK